jgi:hypothetical protein
VQAAHLLLSCRYRTGVDARQRMSQRVCRRTRGSFPRLHGRARESEAAVVFLPAVRTLPIAVLGLGLGCGSALLVGPGSPDAAMLEAETSEDAGDGGDGGPGPLTWTEIYANIVEGDIVSVWGTDAGNVYVGTDMQSAYLISTVGASTWTSVPTQVVGGGWASDALNVYAVGGSAWLSQMGQAASGGLYRYTGDVTWASVPSGASGTFYSVWGSSPGNVYLAGDEGILHSVDGGPFTSETDAQALSVWGNGANDVYAGTSGAPGSVLHSSGDGTWQAAYSTSAEVWTVWSGAAGDAYALSVTPGGSNPPCVIVHTRHGQTWTPESAGSTPTTLVALWGSGPHDVYAGGWHVGADGREGDLFHSTGDGNWTRVTLPGNPWQVRSIWGTSAVNVYVGLYDTQDGNVLLHGAP